MQLPRRNVLVPAVVGVLALLIAGFLAWLTWFQPDDTPPPAPVVKTGTVVNQAGGYSVKVPVGMKATRKGKVTTITDPKRTVAVTITPVKTRTPAATNRAVLKAMTRSYKTVQLTTSERLTVDRAPAVASYGQATTRKGVKLRFVLVAVREPKGTFAISTFAGADTDPNQVLPRVRAINAGFHALR